MDRRARGYVTVDTLEDEINVSESSPLLLQHGISAEGKRLPSLLRHIRRGIATLHSAVGKHSLPDAHSNLV